MLPVTCLLPRVNIRASLSAIQWASTMVWLLIELQTSRPSWPPSFHSHARAFFTRDTRHGPNHKLLRGLVLVLLTGSKHKTHFKIGKKQKQLSKQRKRAKRNSQTKTIKKSLQRCGAPQQQQQQKKGERERERERERGRHRSAHCKLSKALS